MDAHATSRDAANMFEGMWGGSLDADVDPTRVDRMTNMEPAGDPMSVEEFHGFADDDGWSSGENSPAAAVAAGAVAAAAAAPARAPAVSAKKLGKQPMHKQTPSGNRPIQSAAIVKAAKKIVKPASPPKRVVVAQPATTHTARARSTIELTDDEDLPDNDDKVDDQPIARKKRASPVADDDDDSWRSDEDDDHDDLRFATEADAGNDPFANRHAEIKRQLDRAEEARLGEEYARKLAAEEQGDAVEGDTPVRPAYGTNVASQKKKTKLTPAGPRGKQASNARPRVVDDADDLWTSSDEDVLSSPINAPPKAARARAANGDIVLSSDDDEKQTEAGAEARAPPKGRKKKGDAAFSGSVPARPAVDMTPKTKHAADLLEQMMPLGTGRFNKQTRAQRLTAGLRGETETVRGVLGTTEPHPRGPRVEQILALHKAIEMPGVAQLHEAKHAVAKYTMRHEELITDPEERKTERMQRGGAMAQAAHDYRQAQFERLAQAQAQHDKWHKPPVVSEPQAGPSVASSSTDPM